MCEVAVGVDGDDGEFRPGQFEECTEVQTGLAQNALRLSSRSGLNFGNVGDDEPLCPIFELPCTPGRSW